LKKFHSILQKADFLAQNAPKSFVSWLRPRTAGEAYSSPPDPQLTVLLLREVTGGCGKEQRKGKGWGAKGRVNATHPLWKIAQIKSNQIKYGFNEG